MNIKKTIEKVPGGMMIIPMALSALLNTFWPGFWQMGGFVSEIGKSNNAFIGGFLICMGAGVTLKTAPKAMKTGAVQLLCKFAVGAGIGLAVGKFMGSNGLFGLSALAIISAMTNTNCGLFAALMGEFGTIEEIGSTSVVGLNEGPILAMIALGISGTANIPIMSFVGVLIPMIFGMILGNLDEEMRDFLVKGGSIMVPMMAFGLGTKLNFLMLLKAGPAGILLGLMTVGIGGAISILADKATGGTGVVGAAGSSTAGNAIGTPGAIAALDATYQSAAAIATPFVAASTMTTAILTPMLTAYISKRNLKKKALVAEAAEKLKA